MNDNSFPVFLYVQIPAAANATAYLGAAADAAKAAGGKLLGAVDAADVECLETGTPEASILLVEFPDQAAAMGLEDARVERVVVDPAGERDVARAGPAALGELRRRRGGGRGSDPWRRGTWS